MNVEAEELTKPALIGPQSKQQNIRGTRVPPWPSRGDQLGVADTEGRKPPILFPEFPTQQQLSKIFEKIRETAQPERLEEFSWTPPAKNQINRIILPKITVERSRRPDGDLVPCALCSGNAPKCLSFYLLWSADQRLRVVGHICAREYFGKEKFEGMEREAQREAIKNANENFLLDHLPNLKNWLSDITALEPLCKTLQHLKRSFSKDLPSVCSALQEAFRAPDGRLCISQRRAVHSGGPSGMRSSTGGASDFELIVIGYATGHAFVASGFHPFSEVSHLRKELEATFPSDLKTVDGVVEYICCLDDTAAAEAVSIIRRTCGHFKRLTERLTDAATFLSAENLLQIKKWGEHEQAPIRFSLEIAERYVTFRVNWQELVTISRAEVTRPPAPGPHWPLHEKNIPRHLSPALAERTTPADRG